MATNERFDDAVSRWLQEVAPTRLPERVLEATFERTRTSRQRVDWRALLRRPQVPRFASAIAGAAVVVMAAVLVLNDIPLIGPAGTPTPAPSATALPSTSEPSNSGFMWPQSTLEEVRAAQKLADAGDPQYTWQLEDLSIHLAQGGPYREEIYRRFLEEKLGWEDFHWTLGGGAYLDRPGVFFLRCAPSPANVFLDGGCEPTIDEFRYETVHINVAQLDRQGLSGIWVVTSWEMIEPYGAPAPTEANDDELLNGWVAFPVEQGAPAGGDSDIDIWFTALGQEPRRVVGTDTDNIDQACPAFSPDGKSLAYGSVEGFGAPERAAAGLAGYRDAALVIADVAEHGTVAVRLTFDVGDGLPPPCPVWSPDGDRLAFGVSRTSPINPTRSGEGSEVWILRPADGQITVLSDLLATDLEWSPDGSVLAIVGGVDAFVDGLKDSRIHLYQPSNGTFRTLDDTLGVTNLTWSPDGVRIAYTGRGPDPASSLAYDSGGGLRVIDVQTGQQEVLADAYRAFHGIGPVWSPDGEAIAYQRAVSTGGERHEVVLLTADDRSEDPGLASQVVMPREVTTADGSSLQLWPSRVTWSPDGTYLMYVGGSAQTLVVAVPTDPDAPAVVLAEVEGIVPYDFYDDVARVPTQVWQRRPADPAR